MPTGIATEAHRETLRQYRAFLHSHPEERENSIGEVERRLTVEHMAAALWIEERHAMVIDAYNLHNLIAFWPTARVMAKGYRKGAAVVVMTEGTFANGEFNPRHLIEYLVDQKQPE